MTPPWGGREREKEEREEKEKEEREREREREMLPYDFAMAIDEFPWAKTSKRASMALDELTSLKKRTFVSFFVTALTLKVKQFFYDNLGTSCGHFIFTYNKSEQKSFPFPCPQNLGHVVICFVFFLSLLNSCIWGRKRIFSFPL